jgi:hypothetical protein
VEAAWFTPEQGREMWQDYLRRKQLPAQQTQNFPNRRTLDEPSPHRVFVYNTGSEVIPAYACMRVTGTRNINNVTAIDVEKPTSTDGEFLFNSQFPIAVPSSTETGVGWAYRFGVVIMLGDAPSEPSVEYSPIVGSWEIEEGAGPFVVYGHHRAKEATDDRALIGRFAGGGSGGGGHTIWFTITDVLCPETDYVAETALVVTATYYNQSCTGTPPGAEYGGEYYVYDICNYLYGLTLQDLVGTTGRATYQYPLTGECEPRWIIDDLCAQPECE